MASQNKTWHGEQGAPKPPPDKVDASYALGEGIKRAQGKKEKKEKENSAE